MTPERTEQIRAAVAFLVTSGIGFAQILLRDTLPPEAWGALDVFLGAGIVLGFLIFKQETVQRAINKEEAALRKNPFSKDGK